MLLLLATALRQLADDSLLCDTDGLSAGLWRWQVLLSRVLYSSEIGKTM